MNVAVVGCGYWGGNYIRILSELADVNRVLACDERPQRLEEMRRRLPSVETAADLTDVLSDPEIHAVVVCTPASTHFEVVSACLEAGKHVLVEKPITTTAEDAAELEELAERTCKVLMVGHTFLYNPAIQRIRSFLEGGRVGRIYYLYSSRTNLGPIRMDVNALWDLAPHDVSVFNYLLGDVPEWVSAVGVRALGNLREDVGFISLGYSSGIVGHIHVSWADPNKVREMVVVGSTGRIAFNDLDSLEPVRVFEKSVQCLQLSEDSSEFPFLMRDGDIVSPKIELSEPLKNQVRHFIQCVQTGAPVLSGARSGTDVVRVMAAASRSLERNGAPVSVNSTRLHEVPLAVNHSVR
jgi:predicted dehydrogenase